MCSSLSYSDTTSKCFLSTVSQINTSCNVTPNEKSNSSRYCKVFSKLIGTDVKYSSFKKQDSFPLEDGVSSNGQIHTSCIYKSKLYVSRYMGKTTPYLRFKLWWKNWFDKKFVWNWKKYCFPETIRSFKYEWLLFFSLALLFSQWRCSLLHVLCFAWLWFSY